MTSWQSVQANGLSRYELDLQSGRLKVDGPEDHALAMDALARIGSVGFLARSTEPAAPPAPKVAEAVSMKQAKDAWIKSLASSTTKKTLSIKSAAIEGLVRFLGETRCTLSPDPTWPGGISTCDAPRF